MKSGAYVTMARRVNVLGALCCPEVLMAWDSQCSRIWFWFDGVFEEGRVFALSKDCGFNCDVTTLFVLGDDLLLFLFERCWGARGFLFGSAVAYLFVDRPSPVPTLDQG